MKEFTGSAYFIDDIYSLNVENVCGTSACMIGFAVLDTKSFPISEGMLAKQFSEESHLFNYHTFSDTYFDAASDFVCDEYYTGEVEEAEEESIENLWDYCFGPTNSNDLDEGIQRLDYALEVIGDQIVNQLSS